MINTDYVIDIDPNKAYLIRIPFSQLGDDKLAQQGSFFGSNCLKLGLYPLHSHFSKIVPQLFEHF